MNTTLDKLSSDFQESITKVTSIKDLDDIKTLFLGKKGMLTSLLKKIGELSPEERPTFGNLINKQRNLIEEALKEKRAFLEEKEKSEKLENENIDITLPGKATKLGHRHPLSIVLNEVTEIFLGMGFNVENGPEIEKEYYNFEALNIPKDHPARDSQDTFYIDDDILLRTQTSPVQIRVMKKQNPPIRIIAPGRVYRSDAVDATHSPIFHQIEGLVIDKNLTMGDLKWTLETFAKKLYGEDTKIRLRPHHFQFTEPSCEIDVSCFKCMGKGCSMCKKEGFIEILGGGMVHPKVLECCNIDPSEYSGFAFGLGLERLVMFKFNIDDMRLLYKNDIRFLNQF